MTQRYTTLAHLLEKLRKHADIPTSEASGIQSDVTAIQDDLNRINFVIGRLVSQHGILNPCHRCVEDAELVSFMGEWTAIFSELGIFLQDVADECS